MFTGIVTAAGRLAAAQPLPADRRMRVELPGAWDDLVEGESVAVDGCCLTLEAHGGDGSGRGMTCAAGHHTLKRTTLVAKAVGDTVHLERAARVPGTPAEVRYRSVAHRVEVDDSGSTAG